MQWPSVQVEKKPTPSKTYFSPGDRWHGLACSCASDTETGAADYDLITRRQEKPWFRELIYNPMSDITRQRVG